MSQNRITYDEKLVDGLRYIRDTIPRNETLAATEFYPQVEYFTDHEVKASWVRSERALVQFMWKNNCSYLLVPEYTSKPQPDNTPMLIQMASLPFESISDFYAKYISVPKPEPHSTPLINTTSEPVPYNNLRLDMRNPASIKEEPFQRIFEKILDHNTEESVLHLYKLRSNITRDNLSIVTDRTRPMLSVSLPVDGTIMDSEFGVLRVNVTGSAEDVDSKIKTVEISIGGSPFQVATPRAPDNWSTWSFSDIASEGTQRILVRATDNADKRVWVPVFITIK